MSERVSSVVRDSERLSVSRQGLAARRRRVRRRLFVAAAILFFIFCGVFIYGLWQPSVRISHVVIYGADQSLSDIATRVMQGSYLGLVPRDSIFLVPESRIRAALMAAHPDIAAVSLFHNGLTGLSIKIDYRVPVARWCGAAPLATSTISGPNPCYVFDGDGFIFATTSTSQVLNSFAVYESLAVSSSSDTLIGVTLPHAYAFPSAFDFSRQLATFGSPVTSVVLRGDEVDDYLASGTRITYVLGNEQDVFTALTSARADVNLADGSVEYVDLRFSGKIYLKKK